MSISHRILGDPGGDNALLVRLDSGQSVTRVLFDCGDCLTALERKEVQAIDHLMFSHLHMDHVAGFDRFFRCTHDRGHRDNHIWAPEGSLAILQHRFQGYLWNLCRGMEGTWMVHEYDGRTIKTHRFELAEGFKTAHPEGEREVGDVLLATHDFEIRAQVMDHKCPSLAYHVTEKARENVDMERLKEIGLTPGPWLRELKLGELTELEVGGRRYSAAELKASVIDTTPGRSVAYLTDFLVDEEVLEFLGEKLAGVDLIVCEAQYRGSDGELAKEHHHMTTELAGRLARRAGAGELILIHLSDRYSGGEWGEMLEEARNEFPGASFPEHWAIGERGGGAG